ncbi:sigma-70 family RNA polymerase sigma factor [Candidatus Woesearchaeota archaeon]|nr:MAG: sigma-70 family RNA polymerase sigma factor [Candidatus Woesearchaeota archaeon]
MRFEPIPSLKQYIKEIRTQSNVAITKDETIGIARARKAALAVAESAYARMHSRFSQNPTNAEAIYDRALRLADQRRNDLVATALPFVVGYVTSRYASRKGRRGLGIEDLIQEGNIGLISAAERFNPEYQATFLTYAIWWVRRHINKALADAAYPYRTPTFIQLRKRKALKAYRAAREAGDKTAMEQAEQKLQEPIFGTGTPLANAGADPIDALVAIHEDFWQKLSEEDPFEERIAHALDCDTLRNIVAKNVPLSENERQIIFKRFGLGEETPMTLKEIGIEFSLSRERIRQLEARALKKLKTYLTNNHPDFRRRF